MIVVSIPHNNDSLRTPGVLFIIPGQNQPGKWGFPVTDMAESQGIRSQKVYCPMSCWKTPKDTGGDYHNYCANGLRFSALCDMLKAVRTHICQS